MNEQIAMDKYINKNKINTFVTQFLKRANTVVSLIFVGINFGGFSEDHSFRDMWVRGQLSYQYKMLLKIAFKWTFVFANQLTTKTTKNGIQRIMLKPQ